MGECVNNLSKCSNKDLLRIENDGCDDNNISKRLLITKKAQKNAIKKPTFKTEKISSSLLNRAKDFLEKTKRDKPDNTCSVDIDSDKADNDNDDHSKPNLEMNLLVFERESNSDSSDESSNDSQSESSDSDSDDESNSLTKTDCNNKTNHTNNDNVNNELLKTHM